MAGEPVPARGFIAVVPAIREARELTKITAVAAERGLRGWIVTGEHDHFRPGLEAFFTRGRAAGLECELEVVPGLGHDFPDDFPTLLVRGLNALLA